MSVATIEDVVTPQRLPPGFDTAPHQHRSGPAQHHRHRTRPSAIVAGRQPAVQSSSNRVQDRRERRHDVSVLIGATGTLVRLRGVAPASNVSMITIAAPQHGQGCAGFAGSDAALADLAAASASARVGSTVTGRAAAISSRARASVSALVRLRASRPPARVGEPTWPGQAACRMRWNPFGRTCEP